MSAECSIIERHKIIKVVSKFSKMSKIVQISKLGFIFGLWGWASFLSVDWFPACSDSEKTSITTSTLNQHTHHHHKLTTSSCVCQQSLPRLREWCVIIGCLCHGSVYCASIPAISEVCQHARGSSLKCVCFPRRFLEVPAVLDVLKAKTLCHCARWLKIHKTVLMAQIFL